MESHWKKKLLSMFLVLCLSMIPTSAMAEEAAVSSAAVGQEELTTGDPAGVEGGSADAADDPAGANKNDADSEGGKDDKTGANGENGASTPGELQTPGAGKGENGSVNGGNDAEPQDENENEEEAENGIALLSTEDETVSVRYITGVREYISDASHPKYGHPRSYVEKEVECTDLTVDWLASNNYTLTDGWYVVQNSIGVYNKTLTINGTVHLIVGGLPYGLQINSGSIHLTEDSTLNIYGGVEPGWFGCIGVSNGVGEPTMDAFTCDGSAAIHVYGGVIDATVYSQAHVLQSGISLIIEPQRELKLSAKDSTGAEISVSDPSNPSSDLSNATEMLIGACGHKNLQYVSSSVAGHEATSHQRICQDCGFVAFGVEHEESHNWADGTCTDCDYACQHADDNNDGKCDYCGAIFAAKNGDKFYLTLNEALAAAADGSTVKVLTDNTMNSSDVYIKGKTVTLDLNGKTCHGNKSTIRLGNSDASEDATLKLIGTGNLEQTKNESTIALASIYVCNGSTLDLTGWTGGEIATITVNPGATIQTKDISGSIGELFLSEIPNEGGIALAGGSYGVIYFFDFYGATMKAGSLLAEGYAFKNQDGTMVSYNTELSHGIDRGLTNVSVVKCSAHQDTDGDKKCDYCNADLTLAAAEVTAEGKTYYFMSKSARWIAEAVNYANGHEGTIKLLANDLTIENADCKIDLNDTTGAIISASGSGLIVTDSGTNGTAALLDITRGSAKLYGGSYKQISTVSKTLGDLLPDGYGFKKANGTWLTEEELAKFGSLILMSPNSIGTVKVAKAPFEGLSLNAPESITYTDDLTVTASVTPADKASTVTYKWYEDDKELTGQTAAALTLKDTPRNVYTTNPEPAEYGNAGTHTFKCVASSDGYVVSKAVTMTVKPADLTNATLTINDENGLAYIPFSSDKNSGTELNVAYDLYYNGKYLTVQRGDDPTVEPSPVDYTVTGNKGVINAGTYTLTVTGKGNYTGTKSIQFVVKPCELSNKASISNLTKKYDGTTDLPLEQLDSVGFVYGETGNTIYFDRGVDYTVEGAQFENADAGDGKTVIIKFRMLNPNYSFVGGQREMEIVRHQIDAGSATQAIDKAAATDQSVDLKVMNGHAKTYTVDLAKLIPELTAPKKYGDITYGLPMVQLDTGYYIAGGAKVENGVLSLPIKQVDTDVEGKIGTVQVVVSTTNYEDMTLTINVLATNKLMPTGAPTLSKSSLTYGETLGNIKLSGSMKYDNQTVAGTFAWVTPDAKPVAAAAYAAKWMFTPNDGSMYQTVNGTTEILVNKATPAGEPAYTKITASGKTITAAALAVNPNWPAGTVKWVDADGNTLDDSTEVKANAAYQWLFKPADTNNYNEATGTIVLYSVSSGGGSTGGSSTTKDDTAGGGAQTITVPVSSDHGDVKIEATVEGTTATVSVDNSQIDKVIADGAKTVTIDVSGLEGVDSVTVPVEIVSKTNEAKRTGLTVSLPDGAVVLDQKALKTIASGEDVTVSIQQAALTDAQRQAVGSLAQVAAVVDVDLYVGTKQQSRFGGGALTISIPYMPEKGEDTSNLAVWFIRDDGTIETKSGSYDAESGCFVFKTKHLSRYLLVDITQTRTAANNSAKVGVWTQAVMFFRKFFGR